MLLEDWPVAWYLIGLSSEQRQKRKNRTEDIFTGLPNNEQLYKGSPLEVDADREELRKSQVRVLGQANVKDVFREMPIKG